MLDLLLMHSKKQIRANSFMLDLLLMHSKKQIQAEHEVYEDSHDQAHHF